MRIVEPHLRQNGTLRAEIASIVHFVTPLQIDFTKNQGLVIRKARVRGLLKWKRCFAARKRIIKSIDIVFTMNIFEKKGNKVSPVTFNK
ncbi:MAG: hypothetical protein V4689_19250 [Verrucomicrobiota bacterium]